MKTQKTQRKHKNTAGAEIAEEQQHKNTTTTQQTHNENTTKTQ